MNPALTRLGKAFLATSLLISPFLAIPLFLPNRQEAINSAPITPIVFSHPQAQTIQPKKSKSTAHLTQNPSPAVLGVQTEKEITTSQSNLSGNYTIAVLGDSMIDVMQPGLPQLEKALKNFYPQAQFRLLNYGVGASNIEFGLERLTSSYTYLNQPFPPLLSQNPDVVVIESFAYNHWDNNQSNLDRQWLALGGIVDTIKKQSRAKIVLAATVGPDENTLGDGIDNYWLLPDQKKEKAAAIRAYLQNLINFAQSQGYPLADAYHASLDENNNGKAKYINAGDHLHPSGPGGELMAEKIAEVIWEKKLL